MGFRPSSHLVSQYIARKNRDRCEGVEKKKSSVYYIVESGEVYAILFFFLKI